MRYIIALLAGLACGLWGFIAQTDKYLGMIYEPLMPWFDGSMLVATVVFGMLTPCFLLLAQTWDEK